jgi:hypothetical protein
MNRQQLQERPPEKEKEHSFWQHYQKSKKTKTWMYVLMVVIPVILLLISMLTIFTKPPFNPKDGLVAPPASEQPDLNSLATLVLTDMNVHGWDTQHQTMFINWRQSNLSQVNCSTKVCDTRGHSTRQDAANDLRDLESLYWYKSSHPGNHSMDKYIARVLPSVQKKWGKTDLNKGWVYYLLLQVKKYSPNPAYWDRTIQHWAAAQYRKLDHQLGVRHGPVDTTAGSGNVTLADGYRVDHALETGLALVDAGTRYHHPEWVAAGKKDVAVVVAQSFNRQFHLFGRIYLIKDPRFGSHKLLDPQARMGETGQELEALVRTGSYTKNATYLSLAKEMLNALQTSPLRDTVNGGFYFKLYLAPYQGKDAGYVDKSIKEVRQLHTLIGIHLANEVFKNRWAGLEQDMIHVMTHRLFLPGPVPGFSYRVLANGRMYPCHICAQPHVEDWVTSEADNIALEAIQTVLSN